MKYFGLLDEFSDKEIIIQDRIKAELIGEGENKVTIRFPHQDVNYKDAVAFALLDSHNKYLWYKDTKINSDLCTINFDGFDYLQIDYVPLRFKLYLVFQGNGHLTFCRLYSKSIKDEYRLTKDKRLLYYSSISSAEYRKEEVNLITNITTSGYFGFILINKSSRVDYIVSNTVDNFKIYQDDFCFDVTLEKISKFTNFGVSFKSALPNVNTIYDFKPTLVRDMGDRFVLECRLPRTYFQGIKPDVFNLHTYYDIDGERYYSTVQIKDKENYENILELSATDKLQHRTLIDEITFTATESYKLQFSTILPYNGVEITPENTAKRILFSPNFVAIRVFYGAQSVDQLGQYRISLYTDLSGISDLSVFAHCTSIKEKIILDVTEFNPKKNEFIVDFSAFKEAMEDITSRTYSICVAFSYNGYMYCGKVSAPDYKEDESKKYLQEVETLTIKDTIAVVEPMYGSNGTFYVRVKDRLSLFKDKVSVSYQKAYFKDKYLYIVTDITNNKEHFTGYALSYRFKDSEDRRIYYTSAELIPSGDNTHLRGRFDLSKIELQKSVWDVYAVFNDGRTAYFANVYVDKRQMYDYLYHKSMSENFYRFSNKEDTDILFPYFTTRDTLAFMIRQISPCDSRKFKMKEILAVCCHKVLKWYYNHKNITLVYERKSQTAQDNGYYFFKHCMEHRVGKRLKSKICYVIDPSSPDYKNVEPYKDNVLNFMSFKHMIYLLGAKNLVYTYSKNDCYIWRPNNSVIAERIRFKKHIFLQHGVTSLKRIDKFYGKGKAGDTDVFVVSSKKEREIVNKWFGYSKEQTPITGLARWDALKDKSNGSNEIALVPTTRNWLDDVPSEKFLDSDFYNRYIELLNSAELKTILANNDLELNFCINSKYKDYFTSDKIDNKRIHISVIGEKPLNEILMKSKLLITDYSSVCYDMLYMCKPVLFYQFDYEKFINSVGTYINMDKDLMGDRSISIIDLCNDINKMAKSNFRLPYEYKLMRDNSFTYFDRNNSLRIIQELKKVME